MRQVVTFGEIMGRFTPPGFMRFRQTLPGTMEVTFAGAEANVAASLALLGMPATFVTALPDNELADACIASLQSFGIASYVIRSDQGRLGLYFVEKGANQRPSRVLYDREHSAISLVDSEVYPWEEIFEHASWFHVSGITPALSRVAADATLASVKAAQKAGLTVSCDLNFRGKLWRWEESMQPRELAGDVMRQVLPHVDVLIANEEDCADVLGIAAEGSDAALGHLAADRYPEVAREVASQFPNLEFVATTLRQSLSASHNNWGAMLLDVGADRAMFAPQQNGEYRPYEIRNIVDRVGAGDAFAAGLIFSLGSTDYPHPQDALSFAVAASCLAHSIEGDFNLSSRQEIDALAGGSGSGRVVR